MPSTIRFGNCAPRTLPGARFAELLFWVTFFIPTLAVTAGWILVLDPKFGLLNQLLVRLGLFQSEPFNIYSLGGIVFTHLASLGISTKVMMMSAAFRNMDATLEEAARVSGAALEPAAAERIWRAGGRFRIRMGGRAAARRALAHGRATLDAGAADAVLAAL